MPCVHVVSAWLVNGRVDGTQKARRAGARESACATLQISEINCTPCHRSPPIGGPLDKSVVRLAVRVLAEDILLNDGRLTPR